MQCTIFLLGAGSELKLLTTVYEGPFKIIVIYFYFFETTPKICTSAQLSGAPTPSQHSGGSSIGDISISGSTILLKSYQTPCVANIANDLMVCPSERVSF